MYGWGEERKNACMESMSEVRESMKGHLRLRNNFIQGSPLLREVVISSCLLGERKLPDHLFQPDSERSLSNEHWLKAAGNEYLSLTGIEPVSSTWKDDVLTTGRKGPKSHSSYISAPRIEVVFFLYAIQDFVCVHVGDFWCEFGGSSPLPTGSPTDPVTHQPRPFPPLLGASSYWYWYQEDYTYSCSRLF